MRKSNGKNSWLSAIHFINFLFWHLDYFVSGCFPYVLRLATAEKEANENKQNEYDDSSTNIYQHLPPYYTCYFCSLFFFLLFSWQDNCTLWRSSFRWLCINLGKFGVRIIFASPELKRLDCFIFIAIVHTSYWSSKFYFCILRCLIDFNATINVNLWEDDSWLTLAKRRIRKPLNQ